MERSTKKDLKTRREILLAWSGGSEPRGWGEHGQHRIQTRRSPQQFKGGAGTVTLW